MTCTESCSKEVAFGSLRENMVSTLKVSFTRIFIGGANRPLNGRLLIIQCLLIKIKLNQRVADFRKNNYLLR